MGDNEKPPFDIVKASFYLVAFVFGVNAAIILYGVVICSLYAGEILAKTPVGQSAECVREGRLYEGMTTLLASVLAFAAGRSSK